jgi:hypothetical protein
LKEDKSNCYFQIKPQYIYFKTKFYRFQARTRIDLAEKHQIGGGLPHQSTHGLNAIAIEWTFEKINATQGLGTELCTPIIMIVRLLQMVIYGTNPQLIGILYGRHGILHF